MSPGPPTLDPATLRELERLLAERLASVESCGRGCRSCRDSELTWTPSGCCSGSCERWARDWRLPGFEPPRLYSALSQLSSTTTRSTISVFASGLSLRSNLRKTGSTPLTGAGK
jgi:hypothetical protein